MAVQKTNLLVLNSLKNLAQFAVGLGLAVATFGFVFETWKVVLGAVSLVSAYLAAYLYNDIADYTEDKSDSFKLKFKPVARGEIKLETAKYLVPALAVVGLVLAFFIGTQFFVAVGSLLAINFIYSSPYTRFKSKGLLFTFLIFWLEFFKFTTGWLAGIGSFEKFPLIFIASMSLLYILFGRAYKKKLEPSQFIRDPVIVFVTTSGLLLFLVSFVIYQFKLQMLLSPLLFGLLLIPWLYYKKSEFLFERIYYGMLTAIFILFVIAALFFVDPVGIFSSVNANISSWVVQVCVSQPV